MGNLVAAFADLYRCLPVLLYLVSPHDHPAPPETRAGWACLKAFGAARELALPEDYRGSWAGEMGWTRRHWRRCKDAPAFGDVDRLPDFRELGFMIAFHNTHTNFLEKEWADCPWRRPVLEMAMADDAAIGRVLDLMWKARAGGFMAERREALKALREALGPGAYYAGAWPPPAPLWYFTEIPPRYLPGELPASPKVISP